MEMMTNGTGTNGAPRLGAGVVSTGWNNPSPTVRALLADVTAGLEVFRTLDGVPLTDAQIADRARNIVAGIVGNYSLTVLA